MSLPISLFISISLFLTPSHSDWIVLKAIQLILWHILNAELRVYASYKSIFLCISLSSFPSHEYEILYIHFIHILLYMACATRKVSRIIARAAFQFILKYTRTCVCVCSTLRTTQHSNTYTLRMRAFQWVSIKFCRPIFASANKTNTTTRHTNNYKLKSRSFSTYSFHHESFENNYYLNFYICIRTYFYVANKK